MLLSTQKTTPKLRPALVFLFLGFLINLAVTWSIAALATRPEQRYVDLLWSTVDKTLQRFPDLEEYLTTRSIDIEQCPSLVRNYWQQITPSKARDSCEPVSSTYFFTGWQHDFVTLGMSYPYSSKPDFYFHTNSMGWPLVCLSHQTCNYSTWIDLPTIQIGFRNADWPYRPNQTHLPTPAPLDRGIPLNIFFPSSTRILPTQPMFPAVIFNSLFYAILLALLTLIPRAYIRSRRRRSSLCIRCRYNVTDLSCCPECGTIGGVGGMIGGVGGRT